MKPPPEIAPLPYSKAKVLHTVLIKSADGLTLAETAGALPREEASINYILHCVAMHKELREALLDAEQALSHALHRLKDDGSFSTSIALKGAREKARAVITKSTP